MLGHDRASMTLAVYSDLFDEDLDQLAERMTSARTAYLRTEPPVVHAFSPDSC